MSEAGSGWTSKAVLVTGCSSGIGWATAEHLTRRGSTRNAVEEAERIEGAVRVPINNADYNQPGASAGPARSRAIAPVGVFSRHYDRCLETY